MNFIFLTLLLSLGATWPSDRAATRDISADSIRTYISVLAADSLEGREVGEIGEERAAEYIEAAFGRFGLEPKGDSGSYRQAFDFVKKTQFGPENRLVVNGVPLEIGSEYQPLPHSGSLDFDFNDVVFVDYGIVTEDSARDDYAGLDVEGKAVLFKRYSHEYEPSDSTSDAAEERTAPTMEDSTDTDSAAVADSTETEEDDQARKYDRYSAIANKISTALDHGATGVFLYTPADHDDTLIGMGSTHVTPKDVPIIFLRRQGLEKLGLDLESPDVVTAVGTTDLVRIRDTGYNVVGYLPGASDTTIVIGAHYDHLGYGGESSRYRGPERLVHNGADDNGSGTGALIEIARYFAEQPEPIRHSLLFIAFSGEEKGLLGSSHYVRNWTVDSSKVLMMINMDMIGRLATQEKGLAILGTGTCDEFKEYFDSVDMGKLKVVFKESGSGPSDHTAFYNDSIPCLAFFTGAHKDYHTPSDDIDKLDFDGIATVANLVVDIVEHFDPFEGKLAFQRTKGGGPGSRMGELSVTLGIMPDFISEIDGLGVDAVTPDKPADHAGILRGDIIIQMDDRRVGDIYDYMNALRKYRKGDSTQVRLVRGTDTLDVMVEFK
jgi:hypothetical protein